MKNQQEIFSLLERERAECKRKFITISPKKAGSFSLIFPNHLFMTFLSLIVAGQIFVLRTFDFFNLNFISDQRVTETPRVDAFLNCNYQEGMFAPNHIFTQRLCSRLFTHVSFSFANQTLLIILSAQAAMSCDRAPTKARKYYFNSADSIKFSVH